MTYDLSSLNIEYLNPMQEEMLRQARKNESVVLLSPTGSGKTLAYMLPVIESMQPTDETSVLVLVPGRELAIQTRDVAQKLCRETRAYACYGGRPAMEEHREMREISPRMIIGTPGRILDHIRKRNFDPVKINILIIDEFDKCLELGFLNQMGDIVHELPFVSRRILLSATEGVEIPGFLGMKNICRLNFLTNAEGDYSDRIRSFAIRSREKDKLGTLKSLLCSLGSGSTIVFLNYRESVERVCRFLCDEGFCVTAFHGTMEQKDRERSLFRFASGCANIMVSTDLAARGLDLPAVDNVIHYHLPLNSEAYIHRNGRTARWDKVGTSYIILGPDENLDRLEDIPVPDSMEIPAATRVPRSAWETLYIGRGKKEKVNKVDIVGFLSKTGGLSREQLGMVTVMPHWSFAAVERSCVRELMEQIRGQKIKGQKTIVEIMKG